MADISIRKSRGKKYLGGGVKPIVPNYVQGETPPPVNPPGSNTGVQGTGITLNGKVIGGVKRYIEPTDKLIIPEFWEYNIFNLNVDGVIVNDGIITIM